MSTKKTQIQKLVKEFDLPHEKYVQVRDELDKELTKGLGRASNPKAVVKMFPTYVRSLPDGTERGDYLALDLGGTNFRVLLIKLEGGDRFKMENKIYPIPEDVMIGPGVKLFDHIAQCLEEFLREHKMGHDVKLPLGFTFSFPCKQEGLAVGRLVRWTKGFSCEGVEGKDVVELLHQALERKGLNIECVAILNDTVGCLMSCAFEDHNCEIGVILGTGTNACYMERLNQVELWDADYNDPKQVVINTEWGAFGDNGGIDFIRTHHDKEIDASSLNPGKQVYEKMISGMYMGEIARRAIVECCKQKLLFSGEITEALNEPDRFYTKYISETETDDPSGEGDFKNTRQMLEELGYDSVSAEDCSHVNYICHLVGLRAANLASAGIAALLNRINKPDLQVTVAVDGSLYRFHPKFHDFMMEKIAQLTKSHNKFKLKLSKDGSGRGAAFVAAVLTRLRLAEQKSQ